MVLAKSLKWMNSALMAALVAGSALLPMKSNACTGAEQAGKGYVGVTEAKNSHATYWNQALLPHLKQPEVSLTYRPEGKYGEVLALATPIGDKFGIGVHLANTDYHDEEHGRSDKYSWIKFGAGAKIYETKDSDLSIGAAITFKKFDEDDFEGTVNNYSLSTLFRKQDLLGDDSELRLGMLVKFLGEKDGSFEPNFRPGIGLTKGDTTVSAEYYGLSNVWGDDYFDVSNGIRLGLEKKMNNVDLRAGFSDGRRKVYHAGLGFDLGKDLSINVAYTIDRDSKSDSIFEIVKRF